MKIKILITLLLLVSLQAPASMAIEDIDCFQYYDFQNGLLFDDLRAEKVSYTPGDEVIVSYYLLNRMESPIVEGFVRAQIFYNDPEEGDQMIDEFFVSKDISMESQDEIEQEFRWTVPAGAKSGEYFIKTYFLVGDFFNLAGLSFLPYGPPGVPGEQTTFNVENPVVSRLYFSKENTYINDGKYEFGAPTINFTYAVTDPITIKTQIANEGDPKQTDVELEIYEWDDLTEKPMAEYTVKKTISLSSDRMEHITYELPPLDVGAYLAKFTAKSGDETSILKLRFSVAGAKGRFSYLGLDKFPLIKDQKTTIFFCLSNSADYFTDFAGTGTIEILDENGNSIFKETYGPIDIIPDPMGEKQEFTPTQTHTKLTLKIDLYDDQGKFMDKVSLVYDYSKFPMILPTFDLQLNSDSFKQGETLSYTLKYEDEFEKPLDGEILLYLTNPEGNIIYTVSDKEIHGSLTGNVKLPWGAGQYKLAARELTHNIKKEKTFSLAEPAPGIGTGKKAPATPADEKGFNWWLAGIIIIIAAAVILKVVKKK
ncbi:MAG: hypothetical protein U9Q92_05470 [archaeon]|nr:hypothetical protein [archaeon]